MRPKMFSRIKAEMGNVWAARCGAPVMVAPNYNKQLKPFTIVVHAEHSFRTPTYSTVEDNNHKYIIVETL